MGDKKIELRVVSAGRARQPELVDMVIMRCTTGDLGVLPGRVPISMTLESGMLRMFKDGKEEHISVMGGVANVSNDIVTIFTRFVVDHKVTEENIAYIAEQEHEVGLEIEFTVTKITKMENIVSLCHDFQREYTLVNPEQFREVLGWTPERWNKVQQMQEESRYSELRDALSDKLAEYADKPSQNSLNNAINVLEKHIGDLKKKNAKMQAWLDGPLANKK